MEFIKINEYDNYSINIEGVVRNDNTNRILKQLVNSRGYYYISLCKNSVAKNFTIHRLIAIHFIPNPENKLYIDHINNDRTNNNILNLRLKSKNASSKFFGTSFAKNRNKWQVVIIINKKRVYLGNFTDEIDAARKYDEYLIKNNLLEFHKTNF